MVENVFQTIGASVSASARPVLTWLQVRGVAFAGDVIAAAVIFLVGMCAIRVLSRALRRMLERKAAGRDLLARFVLSVAVKCAWALLIVIVLEKLGVAVAPILAGLGVTGFILGFAFQESLGSLAAGVMIAFTQPFGIGDRVAAGGHEGTIIQLDMMAVVLATEDKRKITIPNKQVWGAPIINYTALARAAAARIVV